MTEEWTYHDASTIQISGDVSAYYWPNQLVSITQTTQRFFVVVGVAVVGGNTHLTVSGGGIYALANAPITAHAVTANAGISGLPSGFLEQGLAYGACSKDTPADADRISLWDSVASFGRKNLTWVNLKATLKTYFDGLYAVTGHNHSGTYAAAANGVTNGDNHDHTGGDGAELSQYVALAGRSGGQTIEGDTSSGGNLTLKSTHHAMKGYIYLGSGFSYNDAANLLQLTNTLGSEGLSEALRLYNGRNAWSELNGPAITFYCQDGRPFGAIGATNLYGTGAQGRLCFQTRNNEIVSTMMTLGPTGSLYIVDNCSALSFTDRTDAFVGDALAAIEEIAADAKGNIDHSTLPMFAVEPYQDETGEWWPGRSVNNMVSVLTTGMKQLIEKLAEKDEQIADLAIRLEKLEKKVET